MKLFVSLNVFRKSPAGPMDPNQSFAAFSPMKKKLKQITRASSAAVSQRTSKRGSFL